MAEFFGLLFTLIVLIIVFLPILTFLRLGRISREVDELRRRLDLVERRRVTPDAPVPGPISDSPAVPASPPSVAAAAASAPITPAPGAPIVGDAGPSSAPAMAGSVVAPVAADAPGISADSQPDLEERIGGRGLLYTGVFVLLLGVSFFLKYAFDNDWVNETTRAVIGSLVGLALVAGGVRIAGGGLTTFGQALAGTGFAVLYLVTYVALNFYYLVGATTAFVMMAVITLAAGVVAHRQRSQALAVIAVVGGFLTPALVGGDENAQLTLFTYVEILVIGTMLLALRHQWPALNALSYIGTVLTVLAWTGRFYTADQWLRTLLFLTLFCVAFLIILRQTRTRAVAWLLGTAPVLYHVAAVLITSAHPPAIHIYLIAVTAVGLWLTVDPYRPWLRLAVLLAVVAPMLGAALPEGNSWLLANVITVMSVTVLHVMGLVDRVTRQDESLAVPDLLTLHVSGLATFSLLYEVLQPAFPWFRGVLALLAASGVVALGRAVRARDEIAWLNTLALAFTLVAIGIAVQFDGAPVVMGWAAEGAGIAWIGVRMRNRAFQFGGFVLWLLATLQLFDQFYDTPSAFTLLFNVRALATAFVLVCGYVLAWRVSKSTAPESARLRTTLHVVASALTLAWITAEIRSYWDVRDDTSQAFLYEQMLLSLAWGLYGAILIVVGMRRRFAPLRYLGIGIIAVTAFKVFFYDLWELGGIYRVVGFLGFGLLLVLVSYLYQNRVRADRPQL